MPVPAKTFNEVVQYLSHHEESLRIKKLIFCLCRKYWENNADILNSISWESLLQEIIQQKPNNDKLTFSIYKLVKTLNRPKIYASVAKVVIEQVSRLYQTPDPGHTQLLTSSNTPSSPEDEVRQIVNFLAQHPESERIKKILFTACKNRWHGRPEDIDSDGLEELVFELKQEYPDGESLKKNLYRIAEHTNKKELYLRICELIYSQIEPLYLSNNNVIETQKEITTFEGQIINIDKNIEAIDKFAAHHQLSNLTSIQSAPPAYDPFEVRMEILNYTNPFRAKILLFSLLFHSGDAKGQDWSTLRCYTLDDLVARVIKSGQSIQAIESQLKQISQAQTDAEANLHTAAILVQVLRPLI